MDKIKKVGVILILALFLLGFFWGCTVRDQKKLYEGTSMIFDVINVFNDDTEEEDVKIQAE